MWGMSCVGKTTFAQTLKDHEYYCFDALYPWHLIETLNLSISRSLKSVADHCVATKFVLDGWTLADTAGSLFPDNVTVYVVYRPYIEIISQYRKDVSNVNEYRPMFKKWYTVDFSKYAAVRYFRNSGIFEETDDSEFKRVIEASVSVHNQ